MSMKNSSARNRLIRLIHVAKRELQMDDDTYRGVLLAIGNASSAADLSVSNLDRVLEHMKKCGFKVRPNNKPSRRLADDPESKKIRALWLFLHELDVVRDPSEKALAAYVKRLTGVSALQWADGAQSLKLIEALKAWAMRFLPGQLQGLFDQAQSLPLTPIEQGHLQAMIFDARSRGTYDPNHAAWEAFHNVITKYKGG